jgi:hypothetical protein
VIGQSSQHVVVRREDEIDRLLGHQCSECVDPPELPDGRQRPVSTVRGRPVNVSRGPGAYELDLLEEAECTPDLEPYLCSAREDEDPVRWLPYGMLGHDGKQLYRRAPWRLGRRRLSVPLDKDLAAPQLDSGWSAT